MSLKKQAASLKTDTDPTPKPAKSKKDSEGLLSAVGVKSLKATKQEYPPITEKFFETYPIFIEVESDEPASKKKPEKKFAKEYYIIYCMLIANIYRYLDQYDTKTPVFGLVVDTADELKTFLTTQKEEFVQHSTHQDVATMIDTIVNHEKWVDSDLVYEVLSSINKRNQLKKLIMTMVKSVVSKLTNLCETLIDELTYDATKYEGVIIMHGNYVNDKDIIYDTYKMLYYFHHITFQTSSHLVVCKNLVLAVGETMVQHIMRYGHRLEPVEEELINDNYITSFFHLAPVMHPLRRLALSKLNITEETNVNYLIDDLIKDKRIVLQAAEGFYRIMMSHISKYKSMIKDNSDQVLLVYCKQLYTVFIYLRCVINHAYIQYVRPAMMGQAEQVSAGDKSPAHGRMYTSGLALSHKNEDIITFSKKLLEFNMLAVDWVPMTITLLPKYLEYAYLLMDIPSQNLTDFKTMTKVCQHIYMKQHLQLPRSVVKKYNQLLTADLDPKNDTDNNDDEKEQSDNESQYLITNKTRPVKDTSGLFEKVLLKQDYNIMSPYYDNKDLKERMISGYQGDTPVSQETHKSTLEQLLQESNQLEDADPSVFERQQSREQYIDKLQAPLIKKSKINKYLKGSNLSNNEMNQLNTELNAINTRIAKLKAEEEEIYTVRKVGPININPIKTETQLTEIHQRYTKDLEIIKAIMTIRKARFEKLRQADRDTLTDQQREILDADRNGFTVAEFNRITENMNMLNANLDLLRKQSRKIILSEESKYLNMQSAPMVSNAEQEEEEEEEEQEEQEKENEEEEEEELGLDEDEEDEEDEDEQELIQEEKASRSKLDKRGYSNEEGFVVSDKEDLLTGEEDVSPILQIPKPAKSEPAHLNLNDPVVAALVSQKAELEQEQDELEDKISELNTAKSKVQKNTSQYIGKNAKEAVDKKMELYAQIQKYTDQIKSLRTREQEIKQEIQDLDKQLQLEPTTTTTEQTSQPQQSSLPFKKRITSTGEPSSTTPQILKVPPIPPPRKINLNPTTTTLVPETPQIEAPPRRKLVPHSKPPPTPEPVPEPTPAPTPAPEPTPTPTPAPEPTPIVETSSKVVNLDTVTSPEPVAATPTEPVTYTTTETVKPRPSDLLEDQIVNAVDHAISWIKSNEFTDVVAYVAKNYDDLRNYDPEINLTQPDPSGKVQKLIFQLDDSNRPIVDSLEVLYLTYQNLKLVYPLLTTTSQRQIQQLLQLNQFWTLYYSIMVIYTDVLLHSKLEPMTNTQINRYNYQFAALYTIFKYIAPTMLVNTINLINLSFQYWIHSFLVRWINPALFDYGQVEIFDQNLRQLRLDALRNCAYLNLGQMLNYVNQKTTKLPANVSSYIPFARMVCLYYVATITVGQTPIDPLLDEMFVMSLCDVLRDKPIFDNVIEQLGKTKELDTIRRYIFRNVFQNGDNRQCISYQLCSSFLRYILHTSIMFSFDTTDLAKTEQVLFDQFSKALVNKSATLPTSTIFLQANRINELTTQILNPRLMNYHMPADLSQINLVLRSTEQSQTSDQPVGVVQEAEEEKAKEGSAAEMVGTLIQIEENQVAETEEGALQIANNLDHLENLSNDMNELGTTEDELKRAVESDVFGQADITTDFLPNLPSPEMEDLSQIPIESEHEQETEEGEEEQEEEEEEEEEKEEEQDFLADEPDEGDIGQYENVLNQSIRSQNAKLYRDLTDNPEAFASGRSPGPSPTAFGQTAATKIMNELKELESTTETTEQAATTAADLMAYKEHDLDQLQTKEQKFDQRLEELTKRMSDISEGNENQEAQLNLYKLKKILSQEPEHKTGGEQSALNLNRLNELMKEIEPEENVNREDIDLDEARRRWEEEQETLPDIIIPNPDESDTLNSEHAAIQEAEQEAVVEIKQAAEQESEILQKEDAEVAKDELKEQAKIEEKIEHEQEKEEEEEEEKEEDISNELKQLEKEKQELDEEAERLKLKHKEQLELKREAKLKRVAKRKLEIDQEIQKVLDESNQKKELEQLAKAELAAADESTSEKQTIEPEQEQESSEEEEVPPDLDWQTPQTQEERDQYYTEMIRRYPSRKKIILQMRANEEEQRQSSGQSQPPHQPQTMTEEQEEVPMDVEPDEPAEQESRQTQRHAPNMAEQINRHHAEQLVRQYNEQVHTALGGGRASTLSPDWRFSSVSVSDADWMLVKWNHRLNDLYHVPHFTNPYNLEPDQQTYQLYEYEIAGHVYFASALSHDAFKTVFNKNLLKHNPPAGKLADYHHPTHHLTTNNPDAIVTVELFPINWYSVFIMFLKVVFAYILKSATIDQNDKYLEFLQFVSDNQFFEDTAALKQNQISLAGLVENLAAANPESVLVSHLRQRSVDDMFNQLFNVWYVYKCPVQYQLSLVSGVLANTSPLYYDYLDDKHFTHQLNLVWYDVRQRTYTSLACVDPNARAHTHTIPVSSTNYHSMRVELKGNGMARKSGPLLMPRDPIIYGRTRATQRQLAEAVASDQVDGLFVNGLDVIMLTMFEWYNTSMIPLSQILDPYFQATAARARATNRGKR